MASALVIWIFGRPASRAGAAPLIRALEGRARLLFIGPAGSPQPDIALHPGLDLAQALESCPPGLRPKVCLSLEAGPAPRELECLPCPVRGWAEASAPEGGLPPEPGAAAAALLAEAGRAWEPPWLRKVQVNLPLRDLLGRYRPLVQAANLNFEIGLDAQALDSLGPQDLAQARGLLAGRRITAHLPFIDLAPASADPLAAGVATRRLEAAAAWALDLGAGQVTAHLGFNPVLHRDQAGFCRRLGENLAPLARRLASAGATLALENVFEPDPEVLLQARHELARASGAPAGLCLDVGHALAFSRTDLTRWQRAMEPHLLEVHLHDNNGDDDQHLPVGWGRADWAFLAGALAAMERRPVLTLEPHREPHLWASLRGLEAVMRPGGRENC